METIFIVVKKEEEFIVMGSVNVEIEANMVSVLSWEEDDFGGTGETYSIYPVITIPIFNGTAFVKVIILPDKDTASLILKTVN